MNDKINNKHVIIIGNGFDISLGLETSYGDFIKSEYFTRKVAFNKLFSFLYNQKHLNNWIDIEKELKNYSKIARKNDLNSEEFKKEFSLLIDTLGAYLKSLDCQKIIKDSHAYNLLLSVIDEDFIIFDFNYTDTTREILKELNFSDKDIDIRLKKMHGSLTNNNIVIGVEDKKPGIDKGDHILDEHYFLYKSHPRHYKAENLHPYLINSVKIYFFGHSLGETDHMYFEDFFNEAAQVNHRKNILLHFYSEDGYDSLMQQVRQLANGQIKRFRHFNILEWKDVSIPFAI